MLLHKNQKQSTACIDATASLSAWCEMTYRNLRAIRFIVRRIEKVDFLRRRAEPPIETGLCEGQWDMDFDRKRRPGKWSTNEDTTCDSDVEERSGSTIWTTLVTIRMSLKPFKSSVPVIPVSLLKTS